MEGKIFYIMGKSATGKDTIYRRLMEENPFGLRPVIPYTTRPIRSYEKEGREYHFVSEKQAMEMEAEGKILEMRCYSTVHGPWYYFTADDGQIDLKEGNYLMIGTLESYSRLLEKLGPDALIPIYLWISDKERIHRAIEREDRQEFPKYAELCRRYLADEEDFQEENLKACNIQEYYENQDMEQCLKKIYGKMAESCMLLR